MRCLVLCVLCVLCGCALLTEKDVDRIVERAAREYPAVPEPVVRQAVTEAETVVRERVVERASEAVGVAGDVATTVGSGSIVGVFGLVLATLSAFVARNRGKQLQDVNVELKRLLLEAPPPKKT